MKAMRDAHHLPSSWAQLVNSHLFLTTPFCVPDTGPRLRIFGGRWEYPRLEYMVLWACRGLPTSVWPFTHIVGVRGLAGGKS